MSKKSWPIVTYYINGSSILGHAILNFLSIYDNIPRDMDICKLFDEFALIINNSFHFESLFNKKYTED